jgi:UDP-N-acetylmuramoyl-L-alanyl-D-glutamate--2,6-diaminopimelate ligase
MLLKSLAAAIPNKLNPIVVGDAELTVDSLAYDSRQVFPGVCFVALKGQRSDGHLFKEEALKRGASAFVIDKDRTSDFMGFGKPLITVSSTRSALPYIAAAFYGYPTQSFELIGITGTNGKTTTAFMIGAIWTAAGEKSGVIGTVGAYIDDQPFPTNWTVSTTPESLDLQQLFSQMNREKVRHVALEVTSIAIDQERTEASKFRTAVFTNLTLDHLDYHGSMEAYEAAKARLFLEYPDQGDTEFVAVINADDPAGERMAAKSKGLGLRTVRYGVRSTTADFRATEIVGEADETRFMVRESDGTTYPIRLSIGGLFNVANALAAIAATRARSVPVSIVQEGLANLHAVPGRFEPVPEPGKGFHVLVDYAHTPDGLENLLVSARALSPKRVVVVFGCGGNRETTKRAKMGRIAAELADVVVVTSDNPRNEDPEFIIGEILSGIDGGVSNEKVKVLTDRREAIHEAICSIAKTGDLIVIAGKGHETYQIVKDQTLPFDDRLVAAEALTRCP